METAEFIKNLDYQGAALARAASDVSMDAPVPTCHGWQVGDLVEHIGTVHRWATTYLNGRLTSFLPIPDGPPADLSDAALVSWYEEGHAGLVAALQAAPEDMECWTFLAAPSPLTFWARRQAHETTIHRADAEYARGGHPDGIGPELAADGIDELLTGFHGRSRSALRSSVPRILSIRADDTDDVWTVRLSAGPPLTERGAASDADCEVSGPIADLYLALWNRRRFPAVDGDTELAQLWWELSGIS